MPAPRAYRLIGGETLKEILKQGFGTEFGALWGELQFGPTDPRLGVKRLRGGVPDFPDGFFITIGGHWLYYAVDRTALTVTLLDLIPVL